jgi:tripartite-type tricarboxylate transporter receptor subunit TctC
MLVRTWLGLAMAAWVAAFTGGQVLMTVPALAEFPERPITMIIPWPAGGSSDQTVRAFSKAAEAQLGQPIVVVNKPGAASTIGLGELSAAKPDGYTIGLLTSTAYLLPLTGRKVPYKMPDGFSYVGYMGDNVIGVVVRSDSRWKSVQDLVAEGRKSPGTLKYATGGVGTYQHMSAEALSRTTGAKFTHIPQKGSAESLPALLGGHVDFITETSIWAPFIETGELRVLAVTTETRPQGLDSAPTMRELGVTSLRSFQIIGGPAGMPEAARARLEAAFRQASKDKAFLDVMERLKMMPVDMPAAEIPGFIQGQMATARDLISQMQLPAEAK